MIDKERCSELRERTGIALDEAVEAIDSNPENQTLAIQKLIWSVAWLADRVLYLENELIAVGDKV